MKLLGAKLWLTQAKADRKASGSKDLVECHRRYFAQQTYEKAVKALGLACLTKNQRKDKKFSLALGTYFLHHHTPLTVFDNMGDEELKKDLRSAYPHDWQAVLKQLKTFRNALQTAMTAGVDLKIVSLWKKIDATQPSKDVKKESYRSPFIAVSRPEGVSPSEWRGWDGYQGKESEVLDAMDLLVKRAAEQIGRAAD